LNEFLDGQSPGLLGRLLSRRAVLGRATGAGLALTGAATLSRASASATK
jgi:hypothetical protein